MLDILGFALACALYWGADAAVGAVNCLGDPMPEGIDFII
jgi:predicted branched-subunit amino acid permease